MAMALLCMHINDVMNDPAFGDYGRLIFPVNTGYWSGTTLEQLQLTWYNYIDPDKTVEVCNYLRAYADNCFIDIYTEAEKLANPELRNTGLFFFRGLGSHHAIHRLHHCLTIRRPHLRLLRRQ